MHSREQLLHTIGHPYWPAAAIDRGVHRVSRGELRAVGAPNRLIIKLHPHWREFLRPGADVDVIIVSRAKPVLAVGFDDRQLDAVSFHLAIGPPGLAQPIGAANLEPDQVIRVVDDPHFVCFSVPHSNAGGGLAGAHPLAAAAALSLIARAAFSASVLPKMALPATSHSAPARTTLSTVVRSMPPSTSMGARLPARSSRARTF